MDVLIIATKDCSHMSTFERQLRDLGVNYKLKYVEDDPEALQKYKIQSSPNLVVDDKVVFRVSPNASLPTEAELKSYLNK